jgi:ABC-type multidrug transport system fused ATPase/permease subunit
MNYSALLNIITPPVRALAIIVLLLLADSAAALAQPWLAGLVTGRIIDDGQAGLGSLLLAWLGLIVIKTGLGIASQYLVGGTGTDMAARLRARVYEHMQFLPMAYFHERKQGEVLALLTQDAEVISHFITQTLVQLMPLLLTFIGAFAIMAWLDPAIALLALVLMPVYYLAMKLIGRRIRPLSKAWIRSWSDLYALVDENLGLLPAIKAFVREPVELERFAQRNQALRTLSRRQLLVQAILTPTVGLLASAGLLLLVWIGASHVSSGQLDAAGLVSLLLYALLMTRPIAGLAGVYGQVQKTRGAAERLLEFFAEQAEPRSTGKLVPGTLQGRVRFENVNFAYPGRPPALRAINLEIAAGETVAIIGPNGAGKSTLAWLLLRFAEPDQGRILIDETDIAQLDLACLRAQVGLVAQHTLLLNGTVRENIVYGNPRAGEQAVEAAARAAKADEFIQALPDAYETVIGDQGVRLSGGQRQRLALARTLLLNPPIIVLDEATAMFDPQGEKDFLTECGQLLADRTVIMITHHPVSLAIADRLLTMSQGKLSEE